MEASLLFLLVALLQTNFQLGFSENTDDSVANEESSARLKRSYNMMRLGRGLQMLRLGKRDAAEEEESSNRQRRSFDTSPLSPEEINSNDDPFWYLPSLPEDLTPEERQKLVMMGVLDPYAAQNTLSEEEGIQKRPVSMLRLGKRAMSMLRLGKRPSEDEKRSLSMLRLGKRAMPMLRLGKKAMSMLRLGKKAMSMLRLGKRQDENLNEVYDENQEADKRAMSMLRLGKRQLNMLRLGKRSEGDSPSES